MALVVLTAAVMPTVLGVLMVVIVVVMVVLGLTELMELTVVVGGGEVLVQLAAPLLALLVYAAEGPVWAVEMVGTPGATAAVAGQE